MVKRGSATSSAQDAIRNSIGSMAVQEDENEREAEKSRREDATHQAGLGWEL